MSSGKSSSRILVVDDHPRSRESVAAALRASDYEVHAAASAVEGLAYLRSHACDVVITDLQMPGMDGLEFIREIARLGLPTEVLMITAHASIATAVEAMRYGAFDYLEKPFDIERLENAVASACAHRDVKATDDDSANETERVIVGNSPAIQALRKQVALIGRTDETVLICGESGTGKELVARALHDASGRRGQQMVSLNCPVLSEQLTESELFGHRRGAFTGAEADRVGRFELAQGGTLLLDEITEINLGLQAKLLRVLQERTFEPVGASTSIEADVRVLASTNRNLQEEVERGAFREDLYYRLNVVPIEVPPLRHRCEDVPQLVRHFLAQANQRLGGPERCVADDALQVLVEYDWPGNVRELQNVVTRACVLAEGDTIAASLIRPWLGAAAASDPAPCEPTTEQDVTLAEMERQVILATLKRHDGHRARTAEALGIGLRTLSGKLRSYGVAPREKHLQDVA
ncbi:sigma-54 dependent transcriptional regulator [Aeoliella sp. ICT_H6.2]|uniref:Sigma-54 dependent transcriptional regulator n=1 Tax=Aeoliella straminimaris TaxID=2954799 RepID=A0A9X2FFP2_9BACT|nr:sigma-54 dependent transcriptional regulator [Aeoliella straminimaris]MCO6047363.1 sigma-54 dependent transcriptional regulator [Aeoliella straminimaris]